jgi:hypothetical protein
VSHARTPHPAKAGAAGDEKEEDDDDSTAAAAAVAAAAEAAEQIGLALQARVCTPAGKQSIAKAPPPALPQRPSAAVASDADPVSQVHTFAVFPMLVPSLSWQKMIDFNA